MAKRYIILREHEPGSDAYPVPPDDYLATCNASLERKPYRLRVDADGFILSGREKYDSRAPVLVFGDSVIENYWVDENRRACAVLEEKIAQAGDPRRVLNGGVTGANTLHLFNKFVNKGLPLRPSAVILMTGITDTLLTVGKPRIWASAVANRDPGAPTAPNAPRTRSLTVLERGKKLAARWTLRRRLWRSAEQAGAFQSERRTALTLFAAICREMNIPLWLTTVGFAASAQSCFGLRSLPAPPGGWLPHFAATNAMTAQFARDHTLGLIDLAALMCDREDLFYDGLHANSLGCALIGGEMASALRSRQGRGIP